MKSISIIDSELGLLIWREQLEYWEGKIKLLSDSLFELCVFSRSDQVEDRKITAEARQTIIRIRPLENECRTFASRELLNLHNIEWSNGKIIVSDEFVHRLIPDSVEVHESGYCEVRFQDDNLFWGHAIGIRIKPDGSFQEAVVEG